MFHAFLRNFLINFLFFWRNAWNCQIVKEQHIFLSSTHFSRILYIFFDEHKKNSRPRISLLKCQKVPKICARFCPFFAPKKKNNGHINFTIINLGRKNQRCHYKVSVLPDQMRWLCEKGYVKIYVFLVLWFKM